MAGTFIKDFPVIFGQSIGQVQTNSFTGASLNIWSGYSITGSFVPRRTLNPAATSANEVMQALCTLVMDILKPGR